MANDQEKAGQQGGTAQNNPGNFANDPQRASEAGQKGGQMSGGDLRISKLGMAAAVTVRKMILSVPVVHPNGVAKEAIPPVLKLTGRKVWTMSRKLFRTKTAEWRKTTAEQIARERDNPGFPNIFEATIRGMTE